MTEAILKEIYYTIENPMILNELDANDLLSLKAQVQGITNPDLDPLWELLLVRTASLD
jgi:hypothetical protein